MTFERTCIISARLEGSSSTDRCREISLSVVILSSTRGEGNRHWGVRVCGSSPVVVRVWGRGGGPVGVRVWGRRGGPVGVRM